MSHEDGIVDFQAGVYFWAMCSASSRSSFYFETKELTARVNPGDLHANLQ
jgi:hypothetical protein